jgi:hypothetical protein
LERALGSEPPVEVDVRADDNIEMVSRLLEDARLELDHAFPHAILLPPGSVEDRLRWLRSWPEIDPVGTLAFLGLSATAPWKEAVVAAYERFADHWAAGVAYHL